MAIVLKGDFKPSDPFNIYKDRANPLDPKALTPAVDPEAARFAEEQAAAQQFNQQAAQDLEQLEAEKPGQYKLINETELDAWQQDWQAKQPSWLEDTARIMGGGVAKGVGVSVSGLGNAITALTNATTTPIINGIFGTDYGKANPLAVPGEWVSSLGEKVQEGVSFATREAIANSTPDGDLLDPGSWTLGTEPSLVGYGALTLDVFGQMAPIIAASIAAGPAAGAIVGGLQGGGAAAQQAEALIDQMASQPGLLERESAYYREQIAAGKSHEDALLSTKAAAGQAAFILTAPISALGGYATAKIIDPATVVLAGRNIAARIAGKAGLSALEEGTQEAAESVATNAGINAGAGMDQALTEGTFADFMLGALAGGGTGAIAGAFGGRDEKTAAATPQEMANAIPVDAVPPQAQAPEPGTVAPTGPMTRALQHGLENAPSPEAGAQFIVNDPALPGYGAGPGHGQVATMAPNQAGIDPNMRRVILEDGSEHIMGIRLLSPLEAEPERKKDLQNTKTPLATSQTMEGKPDAGSRVTVNMPGLPQFNARIEQYVTGEESAEALVIDDNGEVLQVPVQHLSSLDLTPEQIRADDAKENPPIEREKTPAGPTVRQVDGAALQFPDPTHAELYDLAFQRRQLLRVNRATGEGQLSADGKATAVQDFDPQVVRKLADALGILPKRVGPMADEYLYWSEKAAKSANSDLPQNLPPVDAKKLTEWRAEREKKGEPGLLDDAAADTTPKAITAPVPEAPSVDDAAWWGALPPGARTALLASAKIKRSPGTSWDKFSRPIKVKLAGLRVEQKAMDRPATDPLAVDAKAAGAVLATDQDAEARAADEVRAQVRAEMDADEADLDAAAAAAATSPTNDLPEPSEAQKEAGNYALGHHRVGGLDLSIENPAGSERKGTDKSGKPWSVTMKSHYGYIKGTVGKDKDHIDVFVKPGTNAMANDDTVYVVDQVLDGKLDEHKVMLGFGSIEEAQRAYMENYAKGWNGMGGISGATLAEFRKWAKSGDTSKPFGTLTAPREQAPATPPAATNLQEKRPKTETPAPRVALYPVEPNQHEVVGEFNQIFTWVNEMPEADYQRLAAAYDGAVGIRREVLNSSTPMKLWGLMKQDAEAPAVDVPATKPAPVVKTPEKSEMVADPVAQPPKRRVKAPRTIDRMENFFRPGREIGGGYWGGSDKVVSFQRLDSGQWSVTVESAEDGSRRSHSTQPSEKELAAWEKDNPITPVEVKEKAPREPVEPPKEWGATNTLVSQDRAAELRKRLRAKLSGNQLNAGIDPEILSIGAELAAFHIEAGARRFADFAGAMSADLGKSLGELRPYLRSWYNGARDLMEDSGLDVTGTDSAEVVKTELARLTEAAAHDNSNRPEVDRRDRAGVDSTPGGRGRAAQQGSAQADHRDVEADQPDLLAPPAGGRDRGEAGVRAAGEDVDGGRRSDIDRDGVNGRARAGGTEPADAGARNRPEPGTRLPDVDARAGVKAPKTVSPANKGPGNFHISDPLAIIGGGPVARFDKNKAAIELANTIREDGRAATREEQAILAGYTGWGSFGQDLFQGTWENPRPRQGWEARDKWLRANVGQAEWQSLQRSIINAHYTDPPTVMAMWAMAQRMGFDGGRVLEPSMGIGNFFGMMPLALQQRSNLTGIELEQVTGDMAKLLYPDANVSIMGYQDSKTPDNFYDMVIGNWPFADIVMADRRYNRLSPLLHDYFFLKALDQVRPGGLVMGITSKGTMDKKESVIRNELAKKGEIVAAFRLPSGAFQQYAGTAVVTDIIILRKRAEPLGIVANEGWIKSVPYQTPSGRSVDMNEYYHAHPDHIVGTVDFGQTMYRPGMIVNRPEDMEGQLERITQLVTANTYEPERSPAKAIAYITNHTDDREGALTLGKDGSLQIVRGEHLAPADEVLKYTVKDAAKTEGRIAELKALIDMRKAYAALIADERNPEADSEPSRKALNKLYKAFTAAHGQLSGSFGLSYLYKIKDPFHASLAALESKDGTKVKPAAILTQSTTRAPRKLDNPSISDAFVLARNAAVNPSLEQIAEIAKSTPEAVRKELLANGAVFEMPNGDVTPADIYLSGNVREKMRQARAGLEAGNTAMERNIEALTKVMPPDVPYFNIEVQFGASWVPTAVYEQYVAHMLGADSADGINVTYVAGRWRVTLSDALKSRPEAKVNFGHEDYSFFKLVNAAISNQVVTIRKKEDKVMVVDPVATAEVNGKIEKVRTEFGQWLWADTTRRYELEAEYNEVRNAFATPSFDGSFLSFEGMALSLGNGPFDLREHQVNAIWRGIVTRKSLNAHEVGTGKAQPLDAKLLTPTGWKLMGEIVVGDEVITQSGKPTLVEAVFPQGDKEIFRVTFSDGSATECCAEHLWLTQTYRERNQTINQNHKGKDWSCAKPQVRSLAEIQQTLVSPHLGAKNHSIPLVAPVEFAEQPMPLDPYLLGALLGDGGMTSKSVTFTSMDAEIVEGFVLPANVEVRRAEAKDRCPTWALRMKVKAGFGANKEPNPAVAALVGLGLMGKGSKEKFIPSNYLFNTVEARIALLQGLMDTDGSVSKSGRSSYFYTSSDRLADDCTALIQSLGGTVSRTVKQPSYCHNGERREGASAHALCIKLPPGITPFRLARKATLVKPKEKYQPARYIVGVQSIGSKPAQCVRVADPSHLYVTDDFIVTHNTFTMGGIAVESRRYGIAKKPLIFAHNANSKTVAAEIQQMYPAAKVLYIDNLAPAEIATRMRQIANDDWDAVVVPHSLISHFTLTEETLMALAAEEIAALEAEAYAAASDDGVELTEEMMDDDKAMEKVRSPTAKQLVKTRSRIIESIKKQAMKASREGAISFEELGVDQILVDEVHEFKKPPFSTRMKIKGLNTDVSNKSIALSFLTKYVRGVNNGGNVHLFTGTPVTNTLTEVFHAMRYIMADEMAETGVDQWDGWFGSFAKEVQDVELNAAAEYEAVTRLAGFINVPELRRMIGQYMDVVFSDDMPEMTPRRTSTGKTLDAKDLTEAERSQLLNGRSENAKDRPYKKVINETADLTPDQAEAFKQVQAYAAQWRNMSGKDKKETMRAGGPQSPIIYEGLAAKASFDVRLNRGEALAGYEGRAPDNPNSKASRAINNVLEIYHSHKLATQVIFTNSGISKTATRSVGLVGEKSKVTYKVFSTAHDIIERLVARGIPREQIALVSGDTSKDKRAEVARAMNAGTIRVVIGSTQSLGVGVNMQKNLRAMHHLDAPWMPGDLEQRNGRGQRQGNQWNTVLEYRYLTDRIDGRRWQVLAIKQRFINAFLKSDDSTRIIEGDAAADGESDILSSFAEAAGDPRVLIRAKLQKKIEQLKNRRRNYETGIIDAENSAKRMERFNIEDAKEIAKKQPIADKVDAVVTAIAGENFKAKVGGKVYTKRADAIEALDDLVVEKEFKPGMDPTTVGELGGYQLQLRWGQFDATPKLGLVVDRDLIEGGAGTLAALQNALRTYRERVEKMAPAMAERERSIERLRASTKEPFHQEAEQARVEDDFVALERDMADNPVPPPAWLRQGAPVDTEVVFEGAVHVVTGHRWNAEGWFVLASDDGAPITMPYLEVKDGQGMALYDAREFTPPEVIDKVKKPEDAKKSDDSVPEDAEFSAVPDAAEITADQPLGWESVENLPELLTDAEQERLTKLVRQVSGLSDVEWRERIIIEAGNEAWGKDTPMEAAGFYDPTRDVVALTTQWGNPKTALHEAFHRLQWVFLTDQERQMLADHEGELKAMLKGHRPDAQIEQMWLSELEAEAFGLWASGAIDRTPPKGLASVWRKIKVLLNRSVNYLVGNGWQIPADLFARAASGEIAARAPRDRYSSGERRAKRSYSMADGVRSAGRGLQGKLTMQNVGDEIAGKLTDMKPAMLAAIPLNYFAELKRPTMVAVDQYLKVKRYMDAYRGKKHAEADTVAQAWRKYAGIGFAGANVEGKTKAAQLADLMHQTTLAGVDPSLTDEETTAKAGYAKFRAAFLALSPKGRALYQMVRDTYAAQADELDAILLENVQKTQEIAFRRAEDKYREALADNEASSKSKIDKSLAERKIDDTFKGEMARATATMKARMTKLRLVFEASRVPAPYFPLARAGQYYVSVKDIDGNVINFSKRKSEADRRRLERDMREAFPTAKVESGLLAEGQGARDMMDPRIVAEIETLLGGAGVDSKIMDMVWQRYLETMPDLSVRKRFIHRKGVAGFDGDALGTFAHHQFHAAHQMARLKYGLELQELANQATDQARKADDPVRGMVLANELKKRHEWVMNPTGSKTVQAVTSTMFVWYLAATPAAAIINMTQTPMMGIPVLGARLGGLGKATAAIGKASVDLVRGKGTVTRSNLTAGEKRAMEAFYESGMIDRTQAHDLAGVGETGIDYSPWRQTIMGVISWAFHQAEVWNREVTALAAYRMARDMGQHEGKAIDTAHELTWAAHFDYSNSSRPRVMQGDTAKLLFVFQSHQVNMWYRLFRDIHQSVWGETPQAKKEAKYQLAGIIGMMTLFAGVTGIFGYNLLIALAGAFFDDDDDPRNFKDEFEGHIVDLFGKDIAGVILKGAPGHLTKLDLTSRLGMADFFLRAPFGGSEGREWWQNMMVGAAGVVPATFLNTMDGIEQIQSGNFSRGIETMAPKVVKDAMKAWRYANEGVLNRKGDVTLDKSNVDPWDWIAQGVGFTPAKVAETYERIGALKDAESNVVDERRLLMNRFALAFFNGDDAARDKAIDAIIAWNQKPYAAAMPITSKSLKLSLAARQRNASKRDEGALISDPELSQMLREAMPERMY